MSMGQNDYFRKEQLTAVIGFFVLLPNFSKPNRLQKK